MERIINFFSNIFNSIKYSYIFQDIRIPSLNISGIIEILILIFVIYKLLTSLKNTRAWLLFKGILILAVFYVIAYFCSFNVIMTIFKAGFSILIIAIVIVFQGELRKLLENIGKKNIKDIFIKSKDDNGDRYISDSSINDIVEACNSMSKVKTGALIVLEKDIPLSEYIKTGITVNADISSQLLEQIFEHNTPLHDGAMIIKDDRIVSATCYLPLSDNGEINKHLGTRHRAAIGLSELSDSVVIVVSEETGNISVAINGKISENVGSSGLYDILKEYQIKKVPTVNLKKTKNNMFNNLQLKFIALFFGIVLWVSLMNYTDPVISKTITNIPVEITNEEVIANDYQTYDIVEGETADVVIKGKKSELDSITKDNIKATADLSKLSLVKAVDVDIKIDGYDDVSIISDTNVLKIDIEELSTKDCNISVDKIGEVEEGKYISQITTSPSTITITGPVSKLNKISRVVVEANCVAAYNGFKEQLSPIVYDKNGDKMDTSNLKFSNNSITTNYEVLSTKEVTLNVGLQNSKFNNGEVTKYTSYPEKVTIAASDSKLAEISSLDVKVNVSIEDDTAEGNIVKMVSLSNYLDDGVYIVKAEDNDINMNLSYVKYIEKVITVNKNDISILNMTEHYSSVINNASIDVKIKGLPSIVKDVTAASLSPNIDVDKVRVGTSTVKLNVSSNGNYSIISAGSVDVTVTRD